MDVCIECIGIVSGMDVDIALCIGGGGNHEGTPLQSHTPSWLNGGLPPLYLRAGLQEEIMRWHFGQPIG